MNQDFDAYVARDPAFSSELFGWPFFSDIMYILC